MTLDPAPARILQLALALLFSAAALHKLRAPRAFAATLAEYRLLKGLAESPRSMASRVDLAAAVGLTPSAITRALRPLEKMGLVSTVKAKRDARLAIATLSPAGAELLQDASGVVNDTMDAILGRAPRTSAEIGLLSEALSELARA